MYLENISLSYFKNYHHCRLKFSPAINCFTGPNASGKTNLLDAIHYLALTKSVFNPTDQQNIQHKQEYFSIRGDFRQDSKKHQIQCSYRNGAKKVIKRNNNAYPKLSEHIGAFPLVMITPYDTDLLREGSMVRRKFLDGLISQINPQYLQDLLKYQRLLNQRNQLLKTFSARHQFDAQLIAAYDEPMLQLMKAISASRRDFLRDFVPVFKSHYSTLSQGNETVDIAYRSELLSKDFESRFLANHQKDLLLQRTDLGVHKDDMICSFDGHSVKKFGSQGQQKSFVIAMKLAQFDSLQAAKRFKPVLLLDDIFDKLDDDRISKLMDMVSGQTFGQIFITDARPERTARILENLDIEVLNFRVEAGTVELINETEAKG
ncbi:MAG: DNA replication and repair protein RecF [Cyclobacteriaceae bacterium]|nr:MAG: DNA replication and repair protein RecF [Cyclobacteriaceae bacterium]